MKGKWAIALCLVLSLVAIPSALAGASGTFVVSPSGGDDSGNIQAAFDAAIAAGPGSVVQLTAGDFYLSTPIIVRNFSGTFLGQGPDQTRIHNDPIHDFPLTYNPVYLIDMAQMMLFWYDQDGAYDLRFENLGFELVGKAQEWLDVLGPADFMWPIWVQGIGGSRHVSTAFKGVYFKGDADASRYSFGKNMAGAVILDSLSGDHTVLGCRFETILGIGFNTWSLSDGTLEFGGLRPADRIYARDIGYEVLFAEFHSGMKVHMSGVETDGASGVHIGDPVGAPSTYLFEHNIIRQAPGTDWAGFEIWETNPEVKSTIVIRNNRIEGQGSYLWGPIFTLGARNAVISNNTFTGSGPAAMYLGAASWMGADDSGMMVKGNNVQGWTVDGGPYEPDWHGMAPIWLGAETSGNTVVGSGDLLTNVFDESGANILVGVNSQGAHVGQAIREAMQARIAAKKLFMSKRPY